MLTKWPDSDEAHYTQEDAGDRGLRALGAHSRKTAYAELDAEIDGDERLEVKVTRLLTHSMPPQCSRPHETRSFRHSMAGGGRGRRDCRRGAALSSLFIKPTHRMARPPCRHMHRAGAWINPCKPRQGSQCSSCHSTCLIFRAHSLGGCCWHQQLAVTA